MFLSIQISILRQYKLPWLNIRRRRWRSPCLPNGGPHTCSHPLKHAHHQVGRAKALKLDFLVKNYGKFTFCFVALRLLVWVWRWDSRAEAVVSGCSPASGQPQPAESGVLGQPHRPGLFHLLLGLLHPLTGGQTTASEPTSASVQTAVPASLSASPPTTVPTSAPAPRAASHCRSDRHAGSQSHWWDVRLCGEYSVQTLRMLKQRTVDLLII